MNRNRISDDYISEGVKGQLEFDDIYYKYVDDLYSYLRLKLRDDYLIEDILQDTFLAVYKSLDKLRDRNSLKTWIFTIAHHRMVDCLRKQKGETVNVEDRLIKQRLQTDLREDDILVRQLIERLDDTAGQIIYGIYILQFTYQEMAEILGIPVGTVKSRAYTARKVLAKWLEEGRA